MLRFVFAVALPLLLIGSANAQDLKALEKRLGELAKKDKAREKVLGDFAKKVVDFDAVVKGLRGKDADFKKALDDLAKKNVERDSLLKKLEGKDGTFDKIIGDLSKKEKEHKGLLDALKKKHDNYDKVLKSLGDKDAAIDKILDGLSLKDKAFEKSLGDLKDKDALHGKLLSALELKGKEYDKALIDLKAKDGDHDTLLKDLAKDLSEHTKALTDTVKEVSKLRKDFETYKKSTDMEIADAKERDRLLKAEFLDGMTNLAARMDASDKILGAVVTDVGKITTDLVEDRKIDKAHREATDKKIADLAARTEKLEKEPRVSIVNNIPAPVVPAPATIVKEVHHHHHSTTVLDHGPWVPVYYPSRYYWTTPVRVRFTRIYCD